MNTLNVIKYKLEQIKFASPFDRVIIWKIRETLCIKHILISFVSCLKVLFMFYKNDIVTAIKNRRETTITI